MPRGHSGQVEDESFVSRLVETFSPETLTLCVCFLQRDGVCVVEDGSVLSAGREFEWAEQRRIQMVSVLRGFRGLVSSTLKEHQDSDADLDVDGDDTLEYGKAQYTEADVIPCSGNEPRDAEERQALRGAVLNGDTTSRLSPEQTKLANPETPTTSSVEFDNNTSTTSPRTCKNSELEILPDDPSLSTLEALKTRIRDLEKQLTRGDRFKCLICMVSLTLHIYSKRTKMKLIHINYFSNVCGQ
uniref:E3 ubiquitin-protein ligase RNF220 middle domain-containing protein n=1 Tax=Cyprinus carpio TaxID=7962 RepID=A0A8C2F5D9_CYPCA